MRDALQRLAAEQPMAHAVLLLAVVISSGLGLARLRFKGVGMGVAGVLFTGLATAHVVGAPDHVVLEFGRELGLVLFVFTLGLQLGPGFFSSWRAEGLRLNALAAAVVLLGTLGAVAVKVLLGLPASAAVGLLAGATTNTPSLGAAQHALHLAGQSAEALATTTLAYAVAYPGGILGTITALLLLRALFRVDAAEEAENLRLREKAARPAVQRRAMVVENPNLVGGRLGQVPGRVESGVIVSRIRRAGQAEVVTATEDTVLGAGDTILVVGSDAGLEAFRKVVGRASDEDLLHAPGRVSVRRVVVTRPEVLGKALRELALDSVHGVTVTRATRGDVEMTAGADLQLAFGDNLSIVGEEKALARAAEALGNSPRALTQTDYVPVFLGIALGVALGLVPVSVPGVPAPVRLGLAGGPLVAAILLGRLGRLGRVVFYVPGNTGLAIRDFGIALFLACVGLKAGGRFAEQALTGDGLAWLGTGFLVTVVPVLVVGVAARALWKVNFAVLSGLVAGSMTDPPALAFATGLARSDAPSVAYAAVYPLTMLLRIVAAQALVTWLG